MESVWSLDMMVVIKIWWQTTELIWVVFWWIILKVRVISPMYSTIFMGIEILRISIKDWGISIEFTLKLIVPEYFSLINVMNLLRKPLLESLKFFFFLFSNVTYIWICNGRWFISLILRLSKLAMVILIRLVNVWSGPLKQIWN